MTELINKRVDVLDKGWIELVDLMPHPSQEVSGDLAIVNAARVSFLGESKGDEKDKKLLFYLLRNRHTSPFEMVEFKFRAHAPLVTWWQWARHRVWNFNAQCLDGDTEVIFDKPSEVTVGNFQVGSKIRIKDLYSRWQTWEKRRIAKMHLRCMDESTMLLANAHIGDVVYAGVKPGFRITTSNNRQIICSSDHKFLFEDGWNTLAEATGVQVINGRAVWEKLPKLYVNGKPLETAYWYTDKDWLKYQYHTCQRSIKEIADLASCSTHTIRKYLRLHDLTLPERSQQNHFEKGQVPWNKGKSYSLHETYEQRLARSRRAELSVKRDEESNLWKGGVSSERAKIARWTRDKSRYVFERDNYRCALCGELATSDDPLHAHHIVPVWADETKAYDFDNLTTLHQSCHYQLHADDRELEFAQSFTDGTMFDMKIERKIKEASLLPNSHATPRLVEITSIEYVGEREMYDLVVDGSYPNFIANWFVVHNSGRYTAFEENDFYVPDVWRRQSKDNKQASEGEINNTANDALTEKLLAHYESSYQLYEAALQEGVSREMARLFLPGFSVYYTWVMKVDAHNLMHFLKLRMAPDAQYEIRVYANAIYEHFFKPALPWTAEAFEKYQLNSAVK